MTVLGPRGGEHSNEAQMKMRRIWRTKAWRERRRELLSLYPRCEWCNDTSQVVNHKREGYYPGYELCLREEVDIICNRCHERWTKRKQKSGQVFNDCLACNHPIFNSAKRCFFCGEVIKKKTLRSAEMMKAFSKIVRQCPEVLVGDRWTKVWLWGADEIVVKGFKEQDSLPWPLVETSRGEVGLPAFMFGTRVALGDGASWRPA